MGLLVIRGCMFAGKTARLIDELKRRRQGGAIVVGIKHALDVRYDAQHLATHDGRRFPAHTAESVTAIAELAAGADVIGVDEVQFFGLAFLQVCGGLLSAGRDVVVAGIHHDAWGQKFPPLPQLVALAQRVETLTSPCRVCGRGAEFTQRIVPAGPTMIGGPAEYEPRCADCFVALPPPRPCYG